MLSKKPSEEVETDGNAIVMVAAASIAFVQVYFLALFSYFRKIIQL